MRELKFRAWDTKRNKMWSAEEMGQDQLTLSPDGRGFVNVNGMSTKFSQWMSHLIPEQYTDLKDKNGNEIYEGDIIKLTHWFVPTSDMYPERWLTNRPEEVKLPEFYEYILNDNERDIDKENIYEIIGNVHQNPELLEKQ